MHVRGYYYYYYYYYYAPVSESIGRIVAWRTKEIINDFQQSQLILGIHVHELVNCICSFLSTDIPAGHDYSSCYRQPGDFPKSPRTPL